MAWLEKRGKKWTIAWRDGAGKVRRRAAYTDKAASRQLLARHEQAVARGGEGLVDPYRAHRDRPLKEHVAEWVPEMTAAGRAPQYTRACRLRLARLTAEAGWATLGDVSADSFAEWRAAPVARASAEGGLAGPATLNHYLTAARVFARWCVRRGRLAVDPLAVLPKLDASGDVRRDRRALSPAQVADLLAALPEHFRPVYRFLTGTGLRRSEAASLRWGDVLLDGPTPLLKLRAAATKSRRADVLPLHPELAAELAAARGDAGDDARVFPSGVPAVGEHRTSLAAAGIEWEDDRGRRADVHALRHTFGSMLSKSGVSPREAMELMRHKDLKLTMRVYTDPRVFDLAGAVGKLPLPPRSPAEAQQAKATGTGGAADTFKLTAAEDRPAARVAHRVARPVSHCPPPSPNVTAGDASDPTASPFGDIICPPLSPTGMICAGLTSMDKLSTLSSTRGGQLSRVLGLKQRFSSACTETSGRGEVKDSWQNFSS